MARRPRLDRDLDRYLVPGETSLVAVRHHWFALHREIFMALGATVFAFWVDVKVPASAGGGRPLHNLSLLLWWAAMFWLVWKVLNWRREWFVATDKRFLLFYGFIRRKVAMMPLQKVTDMTFDRSLLGRIIGYGTFVLESAGQGQALSVIDHVPDAETHYQAICAQLFGSGTAVFGHPYGDGWSHRPPPPDDDGPQGPGGPVGPGGWDGPGGDGPQPGGRGPGPVASSTGPRPDPTADPVQRSTPESWYRSSNLGEPSRLGDTGEIPVVGAAGAVWDSWDEVDDDVTDDSAGGEDVPLYPPRHWSEH
ncbi:MAG TPA: PH domain-containing protein [Ornithinibacter sp.]|nr:PH domain-containing protein [Ornithinibacter sp.]